MDEEQWIIWFQVGRTDQPECCLTGKIICPVSQVMPRVNALKKLGGRLLTTPMPLDEFNQRV